MAIKVMYKYYKSKQYLLLLHCYALQGLLGRQQLAGGP